MTSITFTLHPALMWREHSIRRKVLKALVCYQFPKDVFKQVENILVRQIRIQRLLNRHVSVTHFKNPQDVLTHFDMERFVQPKGGGHKNDALRRAHLKAAF